MKRINLTHVLCCLMVFFSSCKKEWFDAKPNKSIVVPKTVEDYQAILDNNTTTSLFNYNQPSLCEVSSGDYYLSFANWQGLNLAQDRNAYIWASDIYQGETNGYDWNSAYNVILNTNVVLEGIEKVSKTLSNEQAWNNVKGSALFYRSYMFYSLAQEFCKPFIQTTAMTDLGILLRTTSDINVKVGRSNVQQTYDQIINDLMSAKNFLPQTPTFPSRPSKNGVWALLARVYLSMENYDKAFMYADSCLQSSNTLLDFNTLSITATPALSRFNTGVIFYQLLQNFASFNCSAPKLIVDSTLYQSYNFNDLRKNIYFTNISGLTSYKGYYHNDFALFSGLATDEIYLIRAECYARKGNTAAALNDLNNLLQTRFKTGTFVPLTAVGSDEALTKILIERRKELVYRGLRWSDLRRLNRDPRFAITLTRVLNGQAYTLMPNDPKYIFPIPNIEITLNGIEQNLR
jgi:starch-binding outer membrane protein, SusD/RagB family